MLFFLYGEDDYSSKEKLEQIKTKFIKDVDESGYNIVVLEGDIKVENFAKEFFQGGFLSSKKLIIIKNLLQQKADKNLLEVVFDYLEKLGSNQDQDDNIVVFYENNLPHSRQNSLSGNCLKLFKKLKSFKFSQEFFKLPDYKLSSWIQDKFSEKGKNINKNLANFLLSLSGNNLWILKSEIDKIDNYNQDKDISEESIKELASYSLNDNIFLLSEKLANQKKIEAVKLLEEQLELGISPHYLLTMIIRQYRILLQIKSALEEKVSINNLAKYLSLHPFVIKKSINSVNLYSLKDLKLIYQKLLQLDRSIKTSKLKAKTLLNLFLISL